MDMEKDNDGETPESKVEVTFIDNPMAPDVFADEAAGFFIHNGVVKITLLSARVNHATNPGPINRVVIGRLALSIAAAQSLSVGLFDFLKSRGLGPNQPTEPGEPPKLQ